MFGSKNSELTRKYGLRSLAASTFSLASSSRPVPHSPNADDGEQQRQPDGQTEARLQQSRRPAHLEQQREQHREREVEEAQVLDRLLAVGGVQRLQRVEQQDAGERPLEPADAAPGERLRARPAGLDRVGGAQPPGVRHEARGDHAVEGQQQVRRPAAGRHRHAEGDGEDDQQRERFGPLADQRGDRDERHDADDERRGDLGRARGDVVGDGAEPDDERDRDRAEHECRRHRAGLAARVADYESGGRSDGRHHRHEVRRQVYTSSIVTTSSPTSRNSV